MCYYHWVFGVNQKVVFLYILYNKVHCFWRYIPCPSFYWLLSMLHSDYFLLVIGKMFKLSQRIFFSTCCFCVDLSVGVRSLGFILCVAYFIGGSFSLKHIQRGIYNFKSKLSLLQDEPPNYCNKAFFIYK